MWTDDEYLRPLGELVERFCDVDGLVAEAGAAAIGTTRLALELPVEVGLVPVRDGMLLGIVPPTQRIESSVMPVFHHLRLVVTPDGDG